MEQSASRLPLYVVAIALAVILVIAIPLLNRAFAHPDLGVGGTTTPTTPSSDPASSPSPTPTDTATPSPTPTDTPSPTPTDTPVPQQDIAGIHNGSIYILYTNGYYYNNNLQLRIYQSGENISGYCYIGSANNAIQGTIQGTFDNTSHQLSFTCNIASNGNVFHFSGSASSDGSLQGAYRQDDTYGNYMANNNWSTR